METKGSMTGSWASWLKHLGIIVGAYVAVQAAAMLPQLHLSPATETIVMGVLIAAGAFFKKLNDGEPAPSN